MMKSAFLPAGALLLALVPGLLALPSAHALSPPPPSGEEFLRALYESLDGDNWHNNDNWLDDDVHWCDWHGVECEFDAIGFFELTHLSLPDNNLAGPLPEALPEFIDHRQLPTAVLDLAGNAIEGPLPALPVFTDVVDLSDNRLSGPLPTIGIETALADLRQLIVQLNEFEGEIPEPWLLLELSRLDLSDNRLSRGAEIAFAAMDRQGNGMLDLAGNRFDSELTTAILTAALELHEDLRPGGLNLCWNDFEINNPDVFQWIADRHVGGSDFESCLGLSRLELDAGVSGGWYDPERPGEGVVLQLLENGRPLIYSFSFDPDGNQQWLFEAGRGDEKHLQWADLLETRGDFGAGLRHDQGYPLMRPLAGLRMDRTGREQMQIERVYSDLTGCGPFDSAAPGPPPPGLCIPPRMSDRLDYSPFTRLAGTTCDNQTEFQQYSGAWYNPERDGEGFILEVLPDDRAVIYWFTYRPDGSGQQAWMIGVGTMDIPLPSVVLAPVENIKFHTDDLVQPIGGVYGADFDSDAIEMRHWGELTIDFFGDLSGHVSYDSAHEEYGSGDYPIERLAKPMLAECNASD